MPFSSATGRTGAGDEPRAGAVGEPPAGVGDEPRAGAVGEPRAGRVASLAGEPVRPRAPDPEPGNAGRIAELQRLLVETEGVEEFLHGLAVLAAGLLPGGLSCGMALEAEGRHMTAACSDEVASQVDEVQYLLEDGPCPEALRHRQVVGLEDTAAPGTWPGFASQAAAYGIRSCLSLPLTAAGRVIGALNLYSTVPHAFGAAEREQAVEFAQHAAGALAVASRLAAYTALTCQLRASLATRAVIDQALGVIMARWGCNQAAAFGLLRAESQQRNIKLRDLAREIVTAASGEQPQPPPFARA